MWSLHLIDAYKFIGFAKHLLAAFRKILEADKESARNSKKFVIKLKMWVCPCTAYKCSQRQYMKDMGQWQISPRMIFHFGSWGGISSLRFTCPPLPLPTIVKESERTTDKRQSSIVPQRSQCKLVQVHSLGAAGNRKHRCSGFTARAKERTKECKGRQEVTRNNRSEMKWRTDEEESGVYQHSPQKQKRNRALLSLSWNIWIKRFPLGQISKTHYKRKVLIFNESEGQANPSCIVASGYTMH